MWFNRRHGRRGHFWEARFRSVLVQKESHLLEPLRYIVLNLVRTRLAERAGDWRWSSYRATAGLETAPDWLAVDWTLSQFARGRSAARGASRRFVAQRSSSKEIEELEKSGLLGDREFRRRIQEMLGGTEIEDEIPLRYRHPMEIEMGQGKTRGQSYQRARWQDASMARAYGARLWFATAL